MPEERIPVIGRVHRQVTELAGMTVG